MPILSKWAAVHTSASDSNCAPIISRQERVLTTLRSPVSRAHREELRAAGWGLLTAVAVSGSIRKLLPSKGGRICPLLLLFAHDNFQSWSWRKNTKKKILALRGMTHSIVIGEEGNGFWAEVCSWVPKCVPDPRGFHEIIMTRQMEDYGYAHLAHLPYHLGLLYDVKGFQPSGARSF